MYKQSVGAQLRSTKQRGIEIREQCAEVVFFLWHFVAPNECRTNLVESKTRTHHGPVGSGRRMAGWRGWAGLG